MLKLKFDVILASQSPRRKQLLEQLDIPFTIKVKNTDESFPNHLQGSEIPIYLSQKKALAISDELGKNELLITADTIVCIGNNVLNKPENENNAFEMLKQLSNTHHHVYTGVSITTSQNQISFSDETKVIFRNLSEDEIWYYIKKYKPFDKAGSYGAQDWIGLSSIEKIEGSYFNVMGLPVHKVYENLKKYC